MLMIELLIVPNEIIKSGSYATILTKNNRRSVCKGSIVQKGLKCTFNMYLRLIYVNLNLFNLLLAI